MRSDRFDDFSRWAVTRSASGSRRSFLRAIGLGGAASLGPTLAAAGPVPGLAPSRPRAQAAVVDEIDELAFSFDYDIDRIFRFVRDEVVYDPYAGMLRGAKGTLWGLAGNAADQALLLKGLLDAALVPTRIVVGELTEEVAGVLLAAGGLAPEAATARTDRLLMPPVDGISAETKPLSREVEEFVAEFPAFVERVLGVIDGHVADGVATVLDGLERAGITLPALAASVPEEERLRHIWVQYASGTEWVDLDPSVPGAEPGDVFAVDASPLAVIPDDLVHRVTLRLIGEQVSADGVVRNELLAFDAPSGDRVGVQISLMHPTPEAMSEIGVSIGGVIEGFRNFVPTLVVGEETTFGVPVTFGTGGGILDTLGGAATEGDTIAEWLEVSVTTPHGVQTATRTVFDRFGEEARAAGKVDLDAIAPVDFVDAGGQASSFLPLGGFWTFVVVGGDVPEWVVPRTAPEEFTVEDVMPALHAYHYAREVQALRMADLRGARLYVDAPNVTAFVQRPADVSSAQPAATIGMDLIHRSMAVAPNSGSVAVHPLVTAGVVAHAVEHAMFETGSEAPLNLPVSSSSSVLRVFAEAKVQGINVLILTPGDLAAALPAVGVGPSRLIREALAAGQIVIVPERSVVIDGRDRAGWWVVDPITGATRDQLDDGSGGELAGYARLILIAKCIAAFAALGLALGMLVRNVALAVNGQGSAEGLVTSGVGAAAAAGSAAGVGCAG